jgi:hypothetical protein
MLHKMTYDDVEYVLKDGAYRSTDGTIFKPETLLWVDNFEEEEDYEQEY